MPHVPRLQFLGVLLLQLHELIRQVCSFVNISLRVSGILEDILSGISQFYKKYGPAPTKELVGVNKKTTRCRMGKDGNFLSPSSFLRASSNLALWLFFSSSSCYNWRHSSFFFSWVAKSSRLVARVACTCNKCVISQHSRKTILPAKAKKLAAKVLGTRTIAYHTSSCMCRSYRSSTRVLYLWVPDCMLCNV